MAEYNIGTENAPVNPQYIPPQSSQGNKKVFVTIGIVTLFVLLLVTTFFGGKVYSQVVLGDTNVQSPQVIPVEGESQSEDTEREEYILGYAMCLSSCPEKATGGAILDECRVDCSNILKEKTGDIDILVMTEQKKLSEDLIVDVTLCNPTEFESKATFDSCLSKILDESNLEPKDFESVIKKEVIFSIENLSCTSSLTEFNLNLDQESVTSFNVHLFSESKQSLIMQEYALSEGESKNITIKNPSELGGKATVVGVSNNYGDYEGPILVKADC